MVPFPIIYGLGVINWLNYNDMTFATVIANISVKYLLSSRACDERIQLVDYLKRSIIAKMEYAEVSRRSFIRYAFHEVRVPLNSLVLGMSILRTNSSEEEEAIQLMREAAEFMTDTLNDVLSLAKVEEGRMLLEMEYFQPHRMFLKAIKLLQGQASDKNINIKLELQDGFPDLVLGDCFKLQHTITNLLSNSIKFSHRSSEIILSSSFKRISETRSAIKIQVIDQGIGISEVDLLSLFIPFSQINANGNQDGGGTGIGLCLAKQMIELHGGTLTVESRLKQGTTFEINVIMNQKEQISTLGSSIQILSVENVASRANLSKLHCLIVDDAGSNRRMLAILLQKQGVTVEQAFNGQDAIARYKLRMSERAQGSTVYAVIFMDNHMPVMNGPDASRALRGLGHSNLIIGLTGDAMEEDHVELLNSGVDLVLSKPLKNVTLDRFLAFVSEHGHESVPGEVIDLVDGVFLRTAEKDRKDK